MTVQDDAPLEDDPRRAALVGERIERVRHGLATTGAAGALLELRGDAAWLTVGASLHVVAGGSEVASPVLVTADRAMVIAPNIEAARVRDEEVRGLPLDVEVVPWLKPAAGEELAGRLAGSGTILRGPALRPVLEAIRPQLGAIEHERLRWLAGAARLALDSATLAMTPGRTESEIVAALLAPLAAVSIRVPVALAAADDRMRYRHPLPGETPLRDRLMLVLVAERWGLHVAATRMAWLSSPDGSPHPADATAGRVLEAMAAATRPGATLGDVLKAAMAAYAREGLDGEWRNHHQGGTIGYGPRERIATPGDRTMLDAGMAVAWNPSVPGGKAEATLLVREGGVETLLV